MLRLNADEIHYLGNGLFFKQTIDSINAKNTDNIEISTCKAIFDNNAKYQEIPHISIPKADVNSVMKQFQNALETANANKSKMLKQYRSFAEDLGLTSNIITLGSGDYNIIWGSDLPSGSYSQGNLFGYGNSNIVYGTTGEFSAYANNHCASTSVFNVIEYYSWYLDANDLKMGSRVETFQQIHSYIGDGPVFPPGYRAGLKYYVQVNTPYNYHTGALSVNWNNYKTYIGNNRMLYLFLWPSLLNAHYVNGIGYREYSTGEKYTRIVDNWNNSTNRWFYWDSGVQNYMGYVYVTE